MWRDCALGTPPVSAGVLEGITSDTIIALAQEMARDSVEDHLTRADRYIAEEIFFSGTAAEVVPVKSVDHREIGEPGPMTKAIQDAYFRVVRGQDPEYDYWLERV